MLELHMLPVSSGDSTLLRYIGDSGEVNILIDAGVRQDECVRYLTDVLELDHLDIVVASHFHWDHVGGMAAVRDSPLVIGEYWTGDLKAFEDYCRSPDASPYVLRCLVVADKPLRSQNGKNRLVWDGIRVAFADGRLELQVLAPPYALWQNLRQPGVAGGLLDARQAAAYRRRLRSYPVSLEIEDELEWWLHKEATEQAFEPAQALDLEEWVSVGEAEAILDEDYEELEEPELAALLLSGASPWNDMSIVVKVKYHGETGAISLLFPGDLTNWSYVYAQHSGDARCDVLKVPHHCSDTYVDSQEVQEWRSMALSYMSEGFTRYGPRWVDVLMSGTWTGRLPAAPPSQEAWRTIIEEHGARLGHMWLPPMVEAFTQFALTASRAAELDVLSWLAPHTALYYPMNHGRHDLPQWHKRDKVRRSVTELYCTRESAVSVERGPLGPSCREVRGCRPREDPVRLIWR